MGSEPVLLCTIPSLVDGCFFSGKTRLKFVHQIRWKENICDTRKIKNHTFWSYKVKEHKVLHF